jgi:murein DD-endopeptidase MepM/ murein hydrolase activator NlpD
MICETGAVARLRLPISRRRRRPPPRRRLAAVSLVAVSLALLVNIAWTMGRQEARAPRGGSGGAVAGSDLYERLDHKAALPTVAASPGQRWEVPVRGRITSGFREPARPNHLGVDIAATKGTPVHAAADGMVIVATCDPATATCDRDGSLLIRGCGWYVDIVHAGGVRTRYCHLQRRPDVRVGQYVLAGQVIGAVGASGHASGPHVHFEVYVPRPTPDDQREGDEPVDPVAFLAKLGVKLGVG